MSSSRSVDLRLDFCSTEAARYAVEKWHYSRSCPNGKAVKVGAWEDGKFIGAVVFSYGAAMNLAQSFGLPQTQVAELVRIALCPWHRTPTSRVVSIAIRLLRRACPNLKLLVSYADPLEGHDGRGVYAAMNWTYLGETKPDYALVVHGKRTHRRTIGSLHGSCSLAFVQKHIDPTATRVKDAGKHKYALPLDPALRDTLKRAARSYPKRERSIDSDAAGPPAEGGARPTRSLQTC